MSDRRLAGKFHRTVVSIKVRRHRKGIPVFKRKSHVWKPEDDKILGIRPDSQIALLLGVSELAVRHRRIRLRILRRKKCNED